MKGRIHSLESFGTVDGPGVRFVVFLQGCPMRCAYCHNPDTWFIEQGKEMDADELLQEILKYRNYIKSGGVTFSGGEPMMQMDFLIAMGKRLKQQGIHMAVDTSGVCFDEQDQLFMQKLEELLHVCDLFLLDIKQIDEQKHRALTGHGNAQILAFAQYLSQAGKPVWIRHVLVPQITAEEDQLRQLRAFLDTLHNVEKVEVLPYHTMGEVKYEKLGIAYRLKGMTAPSVEQIAEAKAILGAE